MGKRKNKVPVNKKGKPVYPKRAQLMLSIDAVMGEFNGYSANGRRTASFGTQDARARTYYQAFNQLYKECGCKIAHVDKFRTKHMRMLVNLWFKQEKSIGTINNRISHFRTLCRWIGKNGMLNKLEDFVDDPRMLKRTIVANEDKGWLAKGIDPRRKIDEVFSVDPRVGYQIELQWAFGFRAKEAWLFRPRVDDKGTYLEVVKGPKGGRPRVVPVETEHQRQLIIEAAAVANLMNGSLIPRDKTLKQWKKYFYRVLRSCGIGRAAGLNITAHGLRHEYANYVYQMETGAESMIRAIALGHNIVQLDRETERKGRMEVAHRLGHSREYIAGSYVGRITSTTMGKKQRKEYENSRV